MKRKAKGFLKHEPDDCERQEMALERCEAALFGGLRQHLEADALVGAQLARIRDEKLYQVAGCATFEGYCRKFLEMPLERVGRYLELHEVIKTLQVAKLELPANESQATLLSRIPRGRLVACWRVVLTHCTQHQMALSDGIVRRAIRFEITREQQISSSGSDAQKPGGEKSRTGVNVMLEC